MRYIETTNGRKRLPAMTLGTVQLGLDYGIANREGKPDREKSFAMLRAALAEGVDAWDSARAYGDSELVLGDFLAEEWQGEVPILITKCKLSAPETATEKEVEAEITNSVESSLARLRVDGVDYLLLHQASDMERYGSIVPRTLEKLMKKGYFTSPGVSVYYGDEIDVMLRFPLYRAIQIPMGVLDQRLLQRGHLERLRRQGVDVFVRSVFQQGLCFMEEASMEEELRLCAAGPVKKLCALAERANMTVAQFSVSFVRDLPGVSSLVLGADNPAQVAENAALISGPEIPEDIVDEALSTFGDVDYEGIMTVLRRGRGQ
mgnify:CR=1 FL=1